MSLPRSVVRPTLVVTGALLVLCCVVYPGVVTAGAQALFPEQANGSSVERNGETAGSSLIGQIADWKAYPEYVWGRPSAASGDPATHVTYSSGSNLGPTKPALVEEVAARVESLRESGAIGPIPIDLVTQSASGLDPHLPRSRSRRRESPPPGTSPPTRSSSSRRRARSSPRSASSASRA